MEKGGTAMNIVITMSRRFGTGASVIAQELSDRLGIPVYDKAYIEHELQGDTYETETQVIKKLAEKPCIILGRCASEILKNQVNVFNIYVSAAKEDRINRIMEQKQLSYDDAKAMIEKNDKERAEYYYEHTGMVWGDVNNYHMILDTSTLGIENCADILIRYFEKIEVI
jgi:cytidylate kinase